MVDSQLIKISKRDFEEAASKRKCLVCGQVFDRDSDAKIHMVKVHVLDMNSTYYLLKENGFHLDWRLLPAEIEK
jgi:hypothetical protein